MSTEKINEVLGIQNIDDYLSDLSVDEEQTREQIDNIDSQVKENVEKIDKQIAEYQRGGIVAIDVADIKSSLDEIKTLIETSKSVIKHVYESIATSEIVDPEVIQSLASLMESSHLSIKEYIDIYKNRMGFYDKFRLETLKFEQKKELMKLKYKLDLEKSKPKSIDTGPMVAYNTDDAVDQV